jgi:Cu+-exporting ATPase
MHPQIRRDAPGNCPICGITLELLVVTAEKPPNDELIEMTSRFWIGAALALPIVLLEMAGDVPTLGLHRFVPPMVATWIEFFCRPPSLYGPGGRSSNGRGSRWSTVASTCSA